MSVLAGSPLLSAADFRRISALAREQFGLSLPAGKEELVAARLGRKIREGKFRGFEDYFHYVVNDRTGEALIALIDSLTTNHTAFFREPAHFDFLRAAATGEFREAPSLRVWSAACSSGEEPYSIAMTLLDAARQKPCRWAGDIGIVASDISTRVLATAQAAIYEADRLAAMPDAWRRAFLLKGAGSRAGWFRLKPAVRDLVAFERLNLIETLPRRAFHFLFCRNVMIYFDKTTQQQIVSRLVECLEPGGYFFVGHSETLNGIDHPLAYVRPATYRQPKRRRT
jgi:chemotaxis protein methyltransferase CheR